MPSPLDHRVLSQRYFFPRSEVPAAPLVRVQVNGAELACCHEPGAPGAPTVLFFHGNGEVVADYHPWLIDQWRQRGFGLFLAEYRGYGSSTGTPCLVGMLADVEAVLSASGCAPREVVVFGRSVGSIYALELAARHPDIAGLVLESGIADPLERIRLRARAAELGTTDGAMAAEVDAHLDHRSKLAGLRGALLVLHAEHDSLVPASHAERLAAWGPQDRTELVLLPEGDHNSVMSQNWTEYWHAIDSFVGRVYPNRGGRSAP